MRSERESYGDVEIGLAGSAVALTPVYELNDTEVIEYQEECARRAARRVPVGFRAECAIHDAAAGAWPDVPHFDIPATTQPTSIVRPSGWQTTIDGAEIEHERVA